MYTCSRHVLDMFSTCSELAIFMYCTRNSMSHLLSYCGLVDARISSSEKDLPVYDSFKCEDTAYLADFVTAGFAKFALTLKLA